MDKDGIVNNRNILYSRNDGEPFVWPQDNHPARIYIGQKGKNEQGHSAHDFLSRNGLRYGQLYGFAIDMTPQGPTGGLWRDPAHRVVQNGFRVPGKFAPIEWRWTGHVV